MNCNRWQEELALYLYGDLPPDRRAAVDSHLASCGQCRETLEEGRRLHQVLAARPLREPSPELLYECRHALGEALDHDDLGWRGLLRGWSSMLRFAPASGAVAAVVLVVTGFCMGWALRPRAGAVMPIVPATGTASVTEPNLQNMRINGISRVAPDPKTGDVRITLDAERRMTLEGSLDDPRIQQVLLYAVRNYNNPGIRRDTLDALRTRPDNPNVRGALLYALRHDPNAGMRLEALNAVRGLDWGPDLRQALLDALEHDTNPGVRVSAIDLLSQNADAEVLTAFERLAASDADRSVQLRCARAIRELAKGDFLSKP
jgi:hypothetical protein